MDVVVALVDDPAVTAKAAPEKADARAEAVRKTLYDTLVPCVARG